MLLRLDQLAKHIGDRTLFADAALVVRAGDRIGLVGPNGAGKSTLLRILADEEPHDGGQVVRSRGVRIARLRQEIDPQQEHSIAEEAATALSHLDALEAEMRALEVEMEQGTHHSGHVDPEVAERYDRASRRFEHEGGFERHARIAEVLAGLGFDGEAAARPLSTFSGGWLMRVELAKLLLAQPDVLLLDEPTNHLDLPAIQWFEETLTTFRGAVLVVSHDRTFLRRHVDRVAELDGHGRFNVYEGSYDRYLEQRAARREELLARKANQDREIAQMERFVERFRAKATKARQAQSRVKALARIERIEVAPDSRRRMRMRIPKPPRSGENVMTLEGICKAYGDTPVYEGIGLSVRRGERVALAGPNGAGKSTLLRIIAGTTEIDAGERTPGHNVHIAFFAQHQLESLSPTRTVLEELAHDSRTADVPRLRGHLGAFLFTGDDVDKRVGVLSGGEKARLALAKMLLRPANFLVLDEPTNHLDIDACEVLEEALRDFAGTLVFVSHDRSFINALATNVVEVQSGGVLTEYSGNYDDFLRAKAAQRTRADSTRRPTADSAAADASAADASAAPAEKRPAPVRPAPVAPNGGAAPVVAPTPKRSKEERRQARERGKQRDRCAKRIAKLEEEIQEREGALEELGWRLGDPEVFRDGERVRALQDEKSTAQAAVDELYREWERLGAELEALADAPDE